MEVRSREPEGKWEEFRTSCFKSSKTVKLGDEINIIMNKFSKEKAEIQKPGGKCRSFRTSCFKLQASKVMELGDKINILTFYFLLSTFYFLLSTFYFLLFGYSLQNHIKSE